MELKFSATRKSLRVDAKAKTISFKGGGQLAYDALLVATGGEPRALQIAGSDLKNVLTLRSFADSDAIIAAAEQARRRGHRRELHRYGSGFQPEDSRA